MQFYISILGLFVSFLVLINIKTHNRANYYLVAFLILINLFVVMNYATMLSNNKYLAAIFMAHFMPLIPLTGPALYLYVRSILSDNAKLKTIDLIHLILPVLFFINCFRFDFLISFDDKLAIAHKMITESRSYVLQFQPVLFSGEIAYMIRSASVIVYTIISTVMVFRHFKYDFRSHIQNIIIYRWLILLLSFNYIMNFSILYYVVKMVYYWKYFNGISVFFVEAYYFAIGSNTFISLTLFFFPSILYGLPRMDYYILEKKGNKNIENEVQMDDRTAKDFEISIEKLVIIKNKIDDYSTSMPFLKLNFTLVNMSREVDIPVHHLSYFFKEYLATDFISWRNNKKIEYVLELMSKGIIQSLTLDAISKQAGFNSRTTFIAAFKQKTGKTPSEYISTLN